MTNKIKTIEHRKTFVFRGDEIILSSQESGGRCIELTTGLRRVYMDMNQAKELAEILPEFIKKIEEEK